jgi:cell volume regulation protein A
MAILLTMLAVESLTSGEVLGWSTIGVFLWKFLAGPVLGWVLARGSVFLCNRLNPQDRGYYYVLLVGVVLLTYGVPEQLHASGMLAVFTAGFVMGNRHFIYKQGVRNFSAALATIANIGVFVLMGLLVFPSRWSSLWVEGLVLFVVLTFVARPVAVWLGTLGMKMSTRDKVFSSWAGLRGAVPIVLATYPLAAGMDVGDDVFNLVFFAVISRFRFRARHLASSHAGSNSLCQRGRCSVTVSNSLPWPKVILIWWWSTCPIPKENPGRKSAIFSFPRARSLR